MSLKNLWQTNDSRSKLYHILDNIFSAITHGIGFGLAVAGLVVLIIQAVHTGSILRIVSFSIFGSCLVFLYLFSTLYHSLIFTKAKNVFQIFDHSSIFLLIAGSYTPYSLVAIGGIKGWLMLIFVWGITIGGIIYYVFNRGRHVILDTVMYVGMGWLIIFSLPQLYGRLTPVGFWLLLGAGISYTVGALLFSMRGVPFIHVVWHMFVLLGSILMYFSVLLYV